LHQPLQNMENKYRIETGKDHHQVMQLLEDGIYEYNIKNVNKDDGRYFSRVVLSDSKDIVAGIAGWTWAGVCEITQLWVDGSARKNGLGKMLLEAAEAEATGRGCHTIMVRTFSFQAPGFYGKNGYKTEHVIEGFPAGHDYYILIKKITC